jgi:pimeloyl-ACP methyl ester carboxylesterase
MSRLRPLAHAPRPPQIDTVDFAELHRFELREVVTPDGWTLGVERYAPVPQPFAQPLLDAPVLLVHGLGQNRHAWTAGELVRSLVYFGCDVFVLELRGHGHSSVARQKALAASGVRPLPADWDWRWDFDDYYLLDVPAAIDHVKALTGRSEVAYCGHSMGGIIGYGLAAERSDLLCLATVSSPVAIAAESRLLRTAARLSGLLGATRTVARTWNRAAPLVERLRGAPAGSLELEPNAIPMDLLLGTVYRSLVLAADWTPHVVPKAVRLFNPRRVDRDAVDRLLRSGCEKEPIRVLETFARWVRSGSLRIERTGFDIRAALERIRIPTTIVFGDDDFLSGIASTRPAYERIAADYLVWRPVRGNSHIEVTMGHDIRQLAYDLKNLIEYALDHRERPPSLPRLTDHRARP